jgi:glycosyltransferase involved in cell wall biosynthesis
MSVISSGISVLICCYNSASRLPETLRHLRNQKVRAGINWEIIVVDNGSTDTTLMVANEEWRKAHESAASFRIINEPKSGKNHALDAGISLAAYEYILICDDDNWLNNDYVEKAWQIMESDSKIGVAGGQSFAVSDTELPLWFEKHQHSYAVGKQRDKKGFMSSKQYLWGAGMIFRKSLYESLYGNWRSFLSGPKGNTLARGEDIEFCMRVLLSGYKLYYDDELIFKHYMPRERLTHEYKSAFLAGHSYERRILDLYLRLIDINSSSPLKKVFLFISTALRYCADKILTGSRWRYQHEAEVFYLLTEIKLSDIAEEVRDIKALYNNLLSFK